MKPKTRNEYINQYVKYGWTVLPVKKGTKMPAVNWKNYQSKRPTNQELREWFTDPQVGVGIVTGKASGIIVVDEDSYKEHGTVLGLDSPLIVRTGRGGRHYYFRYQEGVANTVNRNEAIDVRGEGGFVVLPPTVHPETGKTYQWEKELPLQLNSLPTLEDSFAEKFIKHSSGNGEPLKVSDYLDVGEGGRNDSLHRIACSILNKVPKEEAVRLIYAANNTYDPPLPDREVETVIKSAVQFVSNNPREHFLKRKQEEIEREEDLQILSYNEADRKYKELMAKYGSGVPTGYVVLDEYFKFIPQNLYMVSALTHAGKTTLVLNIAGRVARLGYKVVVASLEQGVFVIPRLESMFKGREGLDNISFIAPLSMPTVDNFLKVFEKPESRPQLLIIDHLHYFKRGNKGSTEEMDRLVVNIQMLANKLEIPIVVVAHVRKLNTGRDKEGKERPPTMDDLKDSSSLSQIPAIVAMLHRDKNEEEDVRHGAGVFADTGVLYIYKNRVFGKTGNEPFTLYDNGEMVFNDYPSDRVIGVSEPVQEEIVGLEGFFDE